MASQALATLDDLDTYGPRAGTFGDMSDETKTKALLAASSLVASYMKKRFKFPLIQWGEDVRQAVVYIASYRLMSNRGFAPNAGIDNVLVQNYADQIGQPGKLGWLDRVARGDVEPDDLVDSSDDVDEAAPLVASEARRDWSFGMESGDDD